MTGSLDRWTIDQAADWWEDQPWMSGCNFVPSTAVNQMEMWQAESFDPDTIDRELGWAAELGFNTMRVFLHDLAWRIDRDGFLERVDRTLGICAGHGIRMMPVLFDGVWRNHAHPGPQPGPIPGIHNSQWLQNPTSGVVVEPAAWLRFEQYVSAVIQAFGDDPRVVVWDLYNEPGNEGLLLNSLPFAEQVFQWARAAAPSQPVTMGVWRYDGRVDELNEMQLANSDVVTFHSYDPLDRTRELVDELAAHGRPMLCTEYMARTAGSRFETHLPLFRERDVGAIHWGFVSGRTNTIFPWGSRYGAPEPEVWFHDVLRSDGTAYSDEEVEVIRRVTGVG